MHVFELDVQKRAAVEAAIASLPVEWREIDVLVESTAAAPTDGISGPFVVGRSYRDAPEVDGVVLLEGEYRPGDFVRAKVTRALPYDVEIGRAHV